MHRQHDEPRGLAAGVGAFVLWGVLSVYWRQLLRVPAQEILAWRIVSSFLVLLPVLALTRRWGEARAALSARGTLWRMLCSTLLISANWGTYIWAVNDGRILETSLGYFMNPLMNMALGCLFFGERMAFLQKFALGIACGGVALAVISHGVFPWVGLALAGTFSLYAAVRKSVAVEALPGLFVETLLMTPFAAGWILWLTLHGQGFFHMAGTTMETALLLGTGVITAVPMALFAYAARHIRMISLGFTQFVSPSLAFLVGAFLYHEPVTAATLLTFGAIWLALALQMFDGWRAHARMAAQRRGQRPPPARRG